MLVVLELVVLEKIADPIASPASAAALSTGTSAQPQQQQQQHQQQQQQQQQQQPQFQQFTSLPAGEVAVSAAQVYSAGHAAAASKPVMRNDSAAGEQPIKSLNPYINKWTIKVRKHTHAALT